MSSELVIRPLRRSEYDQLVLSGVFDDEKIELLEGALVEVSPEGAPHQWIVERLNRFLARALPDQLYLRIGGPYAASDISEPEPDLSIGPAGDHRIDHPTEAVVIIEVARSSRAKDLGIKARIYGAAAVPLYCVIDVAREVTHLHTGPTPDGYTTVEQRPFDEAFEIAGITIRLVDLLEPPR